MHRIAVSILASVATSLLVVPSLAQSPQQPYPQQPYPQQQQYQQPYQQPNGSTISAGGLAPPEPMQPGAGTQTTPSKTERELEQAEKKDSGRGLEWFFLEPEVGYSWVGMETFKSDGLTYAKTVNTRDSGLMLGGTAGIRLVFLTLGARARVGMFKEWNLATIDAAVGLHFPLGALEPYLTFEGGYAFLGGMDATHWGSDKVEIQGWNARAGFGMDYYVTSAFTMGALVTGDLLFLTRPGLDPSDLQAQASGQGTPTQQQLDAESKKIAEADGSSVGGAVSATFVLGLHF